VHISFRQVQVNRATYLDVELRLIKLAKLTNYLKPFSVTLVPFLNDINATQQKVQDFADMAAMEKIEGNNQRISFSVVILHIAYTILMDLIQETTNIFERC
jgi:hypothetical protein